MHPWPIVLIELHQHTHHQVTFMRWGFSSLTFVICLLSIRSSINWIKSGTNLLYKIWLIFNKNKIEYDEKIDLRRTSWVDLHLHPNNYVNLLSHLKAYAMRKWGKIFIYDENIELCWLTFLVVENFDQFSGQLFCDKKSKIFVFFLITFWVIGNRLFFVIMH